MKEDALPLRQGPSCGLTATGGVCFSRKPVKLTSMFFLLVYGSPCFAARGSAGTLAPDSPSALPGWGDVSLTATTSRALGIF